MPCCCANEKHISPFTPILPFQEFVQRLFHLRVMGGLGDFPTLRKKTSDVPGPGKYAIPGGFGPASGSKHVSILGARSPRSVTDAHLGPGTYESQSTLGGPKHTIAPPLPVGSGHSQSGTLGPKYDMTHHAMSSNPTSPRYSMGGGAMARSPRRTDVQPGPGSYSFDPDTDALSKYRQSSVRIGPPPRAREGDSGRVLGPRTDAQDNPGPGSYDSVRFGEGVKVSIGVPPPRNRAPPVDSPGPGTYNVSPRTAIGNIGTPRSKMSTASTFGGKGHPLVGSSCAPGPGQYQLPNQWQSGGVSISNRPETFGCADSVNPKPGPGEYTLPSVAFPSSNKGFSISPRYESSRPPQNPGPGAYEVRRGDLDELVAKINKESSLRGPDSPRHKLTTPRLISSKATPGPGSYACVGAINTNTGTGMGPKPDPVHASRSKWLSDLAQSPGPGTYDFQKHASTSVKGTTFHKGQFLIPQPPTDVPGPGAYNVDEGYAAMQTSRSAQFQATSHLT